MVEKSKIGGIIAIIGGSLLLIGGLIALGTMSMLETTLQFAGLTWADIGFNPIILYLNFIFTLVWGIIAMIASIMALKENNLGNVLNLIIGIVACVGLFIPIGVLSIPGATIVTISLNSSFIYVDPFLVLIGGILGLKLKD
ncbi:MAG: hypothetical protein ACTSX4_12160 [Candidatus Helarchaeota archaeon]